MSDDLAKAERELANLAAHLEMVVPATDGYRVVALALGHRARSLFPNVHVGPWSFRVEGFTRHVGGLASYSDDWTAEQLRPTRTPATSAGRLARRLARRARRRWAGSRRACRPRRRSALRIKQPTQPSRPAADAVPNGTLETRVRIAACPSRRPQPSAIPTPSSSSTSSAGGASSLRRNDRRPGSRSRRRPSSSRC
jgi:hypothetical protein